MRRRAARLRIIAPLAAVWVGVAAGLMLAEIAVRTLHLVPTRFWEPDPVLGMRLIASKEGWWTQEELEFRVPVRINSHGFRDVERSPVKQEGAFRILVLGDSFIEAMQVPLEQSMGRQLEARLNGGSARRRSEVVSMGMSGFGTAGQLLLYRTRGRTYSPDLLLIAFYPGNDVRNNSPVLEPVLRPVYGERGELERVEAALRKAERLSWSQRLLARSEAYRYLRKLLLTRQRGLLEPLARAGLIRVPEQAAAPMDDGIPLDYLVYATRETAEWKDAWARTESLLNDFAEETRRDGVALAVLIVTSREQIYDDAWAGILEAHPAMRERAWDIDAPERRLESWCARSGIPCVSLSAAFRARRDGRAPLHFHHDGHWTAAGHELAAEETMNQLREAGLLPSDQEEGG